MVVCFVLQALLHSTGQYVFINVPTISGLQVATYLTVHHSNYFLLSPRPIAIISSASPPQSDTPYASRQWHPFSLSSAPSDSSSTLLIKDMGPGIDVSDTLLDALDACAHVHSHTDVLSMSTLNVISRFKTQGQRTRSDMTHAIISSLESHPNSMRCCVQGHSRTVCSSLPRISTVKVSVNIDPKWSNISGKKIDFVWLNVFWYFFGSILPSYFVFEILFVFSASNTNLMFCNYKLPSLPHPHHNRRTESVLRFVAKIYIMHSPPVAYDTVYLSVSNTIIINVELTMCTHSSFYASLLYLFTLTSLQGKITLENQLPLRLFQWTVLMACLWWVCRIRELYVWSSSMDHLHLHVCFVNGGGSGRTGWVAGYNTVSRDAQASVWIVTV